MDYFSVIRATIMNVENNLRDDDALIRLARDTGYSEAHLRDIFMRYRGLPLRRYVTQRKLSNAAFDMLYEDDATLTDIAARYGYVAYDTFTRAFERLTGATPSAFRRTRPRVKRQPLGGGIYGVAITDIPHDDKERNKAMNNNDFHDAHSAILYGVPKTHFGAYGGCTPYPIALKACANYLGEDISYADAMTGCGAAFRMTWNTKELDGGNVDVCHTFDNDDSCVYTYGIEALGRKSEMLTRLESTTKSEYKEFIKAALDKGIPVIGMGMVGPPEAGIITGYRDDGNVMLGWSVFQEMPEFAATVTFDQSGYYVTGRWWENGIDNAIVMGEKRGPAITPAEVAARAIVVMEPHMDRAYAKGTLAYDSWLAFIENDANFANAPGMDIPYSPANELRPEGAPEVTLPEIGWSLMCHDDAVDCICDGRFNAAKYFESHAAENPLYADIARSFRTVHEKGMAMYNAVGGFQRGEEQMNALVRHDVRMKLGQLIREAKAADEKALRLLKQSI